MLLDDPLPLPQITVSKVNTAKVWREDASLLSAALLNVGRDIPISRACPTCLKRGRKSLALTLCETEGIAASETLENCSPGGTEDTVTGYMFWESWSYQPLRVDMEASPGFDRACSLVVGTFSPGFDFVCCERDSV